LRALRTLRALDDNPVLIFFVHRPTVFVVTVSLFSQSLCAKLKRGSHFIFANIAPFSGMVAGGNASASPKILFFGKKLLSENFRPKIPNLDVKIPHFRKKIGTKILNP